MRNLSSLTETWPVRKQAASPLEVKSAEWLSFRPVRPAPGTQRDASGDEATTDGGAADAVLLGDGGDGPARPVELDDVLHLVVGDGG